MNAPPVCLSPLALHTRLCVARLRSGAARWHNAPMDNPVRAMGLSFRSPLLLAAGFDRRGSLFGAASNLGLGGVEAGSFSCMPGMRPAPLLWPARNGVVRGLSLAVAPHTGWSEALAALLRALSAWQRAADYVTINPSPACPSPAAFAAVLVPLVRIVTRLPRARPLPVVAKLPARWLESAEYRVHARMLADSGCAGLLLSAEGLTAPSECIADIAADNGSHLCLISVGGVRTRAQMRERLAAGAQLVQVHRALTQKARPGRALLR